MEDVKDKFKGFIKKVSASSSSSTGKFKGQGRVLGSSSSGPSSPSLSRPSQTNAPKQEFNPNTARAAQTNPPKQTNTLKQESKQELPPRSPPSTTHPISASSEHRSEGFDPFGSYISSGNRAPNGVSVSVFECPVCGSSYRTEEEVSEHIEICLSKGVENAGVETRSMDKQVPDRDGRNELAGHVAVFKSSEPSDGSVEIVVKLLKNIAKEPNNEKFWRIRMSNPKIKEAIGGTPGGVELLECVGFRLLEYGGEMWAQMEAPSNEQILLIKEAVTLLEPPKVKESSTVASSTNKGPVEPKKIDRQVRVFFSVPESVAAKIDLPDSFYNLSAQELKQEADLRRKKLEESQLLIPKSYKEKQAQLARRRYKATVIRIQFPDGVVLQGVFLPWEPTTALYEFVSSALKEQSLEFELLQPAMPRRRVIPRFPRAGQKTPTLNEEELVPSALVKFKPIETDSIVFTGLCNELLLASEPLTAATGVVLP